MVVVLTITIKMYYQIITTKVIIKVIIISITIIIPITTITITTIPPPTIPTTTTTTTIIDLMVIRCVDYYHWIVLDSIWNDIDLVIY